MIEIISGQGLNTIVQNDEQWRRRHRSFWRRADDNGPSFIGGSTTSITTSPETGGTADSSYGGKDASGNDVIPRYPLESASRWVLRKQRAKSPSIVRHIVDHYVAHVFRGDVTRAGITPASQTILDDADGYGTPLHILLRKQTRAALVQQVAYLLIDSTLADDASTAADAVAQGARLIVRPIQPDQVLCHIAGGAALVEAVISMIALDGSPFLWHVTATQTRRIDLNPKGDTVLSIGPWKAHGYGGCPLVPICELPRFVPPVAESQKRMAVLDSLLSGELHAAAFSQPVFTGVDPALTLELIRSNEYALAFPDPNAKAFMLGSDVAQAASLSGERDKELENAYREAKVAPAGVSPGAPESGLARAYRFVDADVELASIAEAVERSERLVWILLGTGAGFTPPQVTYPRSFIPTDDAAELDKVLAVSASNLPQAIKKHFIMQYAQTEGLSEDELDAVEGELDNGTGDDSVDGSGAPEDTGS